MKLCSFILSMLYSAGARGCTSGKDKTMPVHKRGDRWHYAFCIRGVRYRGALPEARTKVQAQKAETKIRQEVYDGRYGRPTGETSFEKFVQDVYKPWAK